MAEEHGAGTQEQTGHESAPGATGPVSSQTTQTPDASAQGGAPAPAQTDAALSQRIAEMEAAHARHVQQIQGWENQSRQHMTENEELRRELEATRTQLQSVGAALTGQNPNQRQGPRNAAEAIQAYLSGDDEAANSFFDTSRGQSGDNHTRELVNEQIMAALGVLQRQSVPFTMHPELNDVANPMRKDILEAYDQVVSDPNLRLVYTEDPNSQVVLPGPDGQNRNYDMRLLDRAALQVKAQAALTQGARNEQARQAVGDTYSQTGSGDSSASESQVDPRLLFSEREMQQFMDPAVQRALPSSVGRDPASIATYLAEGMSDAEKTRRVEQYRARRQSQRV